MDAAAMPEPVKKRGRPRKVVVEDALAAEGKGSVRKASTKTAAAATAGKGTGKATSVKATAAKGVSATATTTKAAAKGKTVVEKAAAVAPKREKKVTLATPSSSKILEEVFSTDTLKRPSVEGAQSQTVKKPDVNVDSTKKITPTPQPSTPSVSQTKPSQPKTISSAARPVLPPTPKPAAPVKQPTQTSPTSSTPKPPTASTQLPRSTTIPLPNNPRSPYVFSSPAPTRPKPLSAEAIEAQQTEAAIRSGRIPPKYKPAARRVTTIMVGIPIIIVVGWDLYKRYDKTIRTKFDVEVVKKPSS